MSEIRGAGACLSANFEKYGLRKLLEMHLTQPRVVENDQFIANTNAHFKTI